MGPAAEGGDGNGDRPPAPHQGPNRVEMSLARDNSDGTLFVIVQVTDGVQYMRARVNDVKAVERFGMALLKMAHEMQAATGTLS